MTNPFDWPGPNFLLFYVVVIISVIAIMLVLRSLLEPGDPPKLDTMDPYLIACLRGGPAEAIRVATLMLVDRGLLVVDLVGLLAKGPPELARRPLEREIMSFFQVSEPAHKVVLDGRVLQTTSHYERTLRRMSLFPTPEVQMRRVLLVSGMAAMLLGVGFYKISLAVERGHHNFTFLMILMGIGAIALFKLGFPVQTAVGRRLLADLRVLFAGLHRRAESLPPGGQTNEAALLAGVFGLGALPKATFPFVHLLNAPARTGGGADGSSCGSSCGGGCGGGCGGCGG